MTFKIIELNIKLRSILIEGREFEPFFVAYLTSDIRAGHRGLFASDDYYQRIINGKCKKILNANQLIIGERYDRHTYKWPQIDVNNVKLVYNTKRSIMPDSAICIHVFCEIACDKTEWGCHTCGWCCVYLSDLFKKSITVPLCDHGLSKIGSRGSVTIDLISQPPLNFDDNNNNNITSLPYIAPYPPDKTRLAGITSNILNEYCNNIDEMVSKYTVTDSRIRIFQSPNYTSCGGCLVRPPCAFLLNSGISITCEYAYLRLLGLVLRRRCRCISNPNVSEETVLQAFLDDRFDPNENGAILMDVATCISTACTYLYDEVMRPDEYGLCIGEDFIRFLTTTITGDCEDFSHHALSILWDILHAKSSITPGKWKTVEMQRLQQIRKNYIATFAIKAVTRPSVSGCSTTSPNFSAHACCDLVPLRRMSMMLTNSGNRRASDVIDKIATQRGISYDDVNHKDLNIIVGEGTGRVASHINNKSDPSMTSSFTKKTIMDIFSNFLPNINSPYFTDWRQGSRFYLHGLSAYLHDTLIEPVVNNNGTIWPVSCVLYLNQQNNKIGPNHIDYISGNAIAIALPDPSDMALDIMRQMEKFEYPIEDVSYIYQRESEWIYKSPVLCDRFSQLKKAFRFTHQQLAITPDYQPSQYISQSFFQIGQLCLPKQLVEITIKLTDITTNVINAIETLMKRPDISSHFTVEDIILEDFNIPGIANVSIIFSV